MSVRRIDYGKFAAILFLTSDHWRQVKSLKTEGVRNYKTTVKCKN
jgi:hypothetical protein